VPIHFARNREDRSTDENAKEMIGAEVPAGADALDCKTSPRANRFERIHRSVAGVPSAGYSDVSFRSDSQLAGTLPAGPGVG
jgi:hypothetical protein